MKDIKTMSMKEIIDEFVRLTKKPLKKFADRKTAEARLAKARSEADDRAMKGFDRPTGKRGTTAGSKLFASWKRKDVAAARSLKSRVLVAKDDGEDCEFKSVRAAFDELNLPLGKHIAFRGELKKHGKLEFKNGNHTYFFTIVEK